MIRINVCDFTQFLHYVCKFKSEFFFTPKKFEIETCENFQWNFICQEFQHYTDNKVNI